jgi:CRISPR-associated protein Cmr4
MYKIAKPLFMHCQSPLHAGSGSDLGIVDLPIQRERHTSFPKIESSSLKGALREAVEYKVNSKSFSKLDEDDVKIHRVFGYDSGGLSKSEEDALKTALKDGGKDEKTDFAGAVGFTDARLLLFPIKSMKGVFAWATCERVLKQFVVDMQLTGDDNLSLGIPTLASVSNSSALIVGDKKVILEEYTFNVDKNGNVDALATTLANYLGILETDLKAKLIILPDDDFKDFVNLSTEVITRTKIDNATGTVATGALFTEEFLPAESVMYSLVMAHDEFRANSDFTANEVMNFFDTHLPRIVQIGGNATLGKGLTQLNFKSESE